MSKLFLVSFVVAVFHASFAFADDYPAADEKWTWQGEGKVQELVQQQNGSEIWGKFAGDLKRYINAQKPAGQGDCLSETAFIFENPLKAVEKCRHLTDSVAKAAADVNKVDWDTILSRIAARMDVKAMLKPSALKPCAASDLHIMQLKDLFRSVTDEANAAFAGLSEADREFLFTQSPELASQFVQHIYITQNMATFPDNRKVLDLSVNVKYAHLYSAAGEALGVANAEFLDSLLKALSSLPGTAKDIPSGVSGTVLLCEDTDFGKFIVGGDGPNTYDGVEDACLIIDIGGNDTYKGPVGSTNKAGRRLSMVIDFSGDDVYEGGDYSLGVGMMGVALVCDVKGNDRYSGKRVTQGAGYFGVGVLFDMQGNDTYDAQEYAHGAGLFGAGILLDGSGDDTYNAWLYSQGFGWSRGLGLFYDCAGADSYKVDGHYPSPYEDKGEFNSMAQGFGIGFRTLASGGVGVMMDGGGNDTYRSGQFGTAGGYFFGMGIVCDYGGNDKYDAGRYGLAFAPHAAAGILMDLKGNDEYNGRSTATCSGTWDSSISFLVDNEGDDKYTAAGISLGGATITSLAVLVDGGGEDTYVHNGADLVTMGYGGHPEDEGRKSISVGMLLDFGGDADTYTSDTKDGKAAVRDNNSSKLFTENGKDGAIGHGFFLDSKEQLKLE